MKKNLFAWALLSVVAVLFTGCASVQDYSLRSYQGPLPMGDYQHLNADAYGATTLPAKL